MAKKQKKVVIDLVDPAKFEDPKPDLVIEPPTVSTPALPDKMIQVRNQGKPFPCDLTAWGYGMRWPTNAVYTIPMSKYVELLTKGLDGVSA